MESAAIGEKQKRQRPPTGTGRRVSVDVVREILDRLPLKSIARFECACKLWSSLIDSIIRRRLVDEMGRSKIRFDEISERVAAQRAQLDAVGLRQRRDRLKGMFDEVVSFVVFPDDMARYVDRVEGLRGLVDTLRLLAGGLADNIGLHIEFLDGLVDAAGGMEQEAAAA